MTTVVWIILAVIAALVIVGALTGTFFGNRESVDRVRRVDPEAAARIEQQRAENAQRGFGIGGGGGL